MAANFQLLSQIEIINRESSDVYSGCSKLEPVAAVVGNKVKKRDPDQTIDWSEWLRSLVYQDLKWMPSIATRHRSRSDFGITDVSEQHTASLEFYGSLTDSGLQLDLASPHGPNLSSDTVDNCTPRIERDCCGQC
ncbi:hypothetical protein J1614_009317 [Plenodomus biglobosus]|nr:hypothetical protein J1614_009317 [Plenodomus biglobosus]